MSKSMPILLLLITVLGSAQAALFYSSGNASFVVVGSSYYIVSKNNTHISIQSTDSTFETCNLEYKDSHVGRIQVAAIERKILLLFRQNTTRFKMLNLDPFLCLYNPLPNLETPVESTLDPQIILRHNALDIFLKGHRNCLPCRFDVNGNRLQVNGQLAHANDPQSFIVKEFVEKKPSLIYAFVGNFVDGTSVLKVLDVYFNKTTEIYFNHRIETLATNSGSNQSWIGITYIGLGSPHERVLALYTSNLELLFETRVKHTTGFTLYDTLLSINSTGHSFVNSIQARPLATVQYSTYALYNPKGVNVVRADVKSFSINAKYDWQLFLNNDKFCSAVHEYQAKITTSTIICY